MKKDITNGFCCAMFIIAMVIWIGSLVNAFVSVDVSQSNTTSVMAEELSNSADELEELVYENYTLEEMGLE